MQDYEMCLLDILCLYNRLFGGSLCFQQNYQTLLLLLPQYFWVERFLDGALYNLVRFLAFLEPCFVKLFTEKSPVSISHRTRRVLAQYLRL